MVNTGNRGLNMNDQSIYDSVVGTHPSNQCIEGAS